MRVPLGWVLGLLVAIAGCDQPRDNTRAAPAVAPAADIAAPTLDVPPPERTPSGERLGTFDSAEALNDFLRQRRGLRRRALGYGSGAGVLGLLGTGMGGGGTGEGTIGLGSAGLVGTDSITNIQVQGVDEGGIVKTHGDHLVVLRRGRLFTARVGDDSLDPIAAVDVGPKGHHQAWYDEMLIHRDQVLVIGYSYAYGGTEVARFDIGADGTLRHTVTDVLHSNDYYASRNYTSRLIGDTLVFYMPHTLGNHWPEAGAKPNGVPAVCRAKGETCEAWHGIVEATDVYRPAGDGPTDVLHTVVRCDLSKGAEAMRCKGRGVLGPASRNFFVSANAVYVWTSDPDWKPAPPWAPKHSTTSAAVYRIDLEDASVASLLTEGSPIDQFSFSETPDGHLNVLLRARGSGEGMWHAEGNLSQDVALLRVPLSEFVPGTARLASADHYTDLPDTVGPPGMTFHNRFVGDVVLYGLGNGRNAPTEGATRLHAHRLGGTTTSIPLEHPVDRIEPIGSNAVAIGSTGYDLNFVSVDLSDTPTAVGTHVQRDANQGETRSHGFFYRAASDTKGTLGLPLRHGRPDRRRSGSAEILYLSVEDLQFTPLGTLQSDRRTTRSDNCRVSCVDWYGNARPLFLGDRVLALLGYELVEGKFRVGELLERRRTNLLDAL